MQGKRILLGLTGGVAAYKSAELTRLFIKAGADVRVVQAADLKVEMSSLTGESDAIECCAERRSNLAAHVRRVHCRRARRRLLLRSRDLREAGRASMAG